VTAVSCAERLQRECSPTLALRVEAPTPRIASPSVAAVKTFNLGISWIRNDCGAEASEVPEDVSAAR